MKRGARSLFCVLVLLALSMSAAAQDSFTARIPATIAAGNYAEAKALIAEAIKIGVISSAVAESYRREIQKAEARPAEAIPAPKTATKGTPRSGPVPDRLPLPYQPGSEKQSRIYVTYTKLNRATNRYYSGRTSMVVDLRRSFDIQAVEAVKLRDRNHHVDENAEPRDIAFDAAEVDQFDVGAAIDYEARYHDLAYWRIRGREQQLIDFRGGAQSDTGTPHRTENVLRAVAKDNPLGKQFHAAATAHWGQLYRYTGH